MKLRSLLFVPGDRPERFAKGAASGADALILDLEDSVAPEAKPDARRAVADCLAQDRSLPLLVRINPLASAHVEADLAAVLPVRPDALVLPKAEGSTAIEALAARMGESAVPILPIATETPAAIFALGSYAAVADRLLGLTWGAEDLPAALGASTARDESGAYTPPYELARSLTLFAAHAAAVPAIETVFPAIADLDGLSAYAARGRRDGFSGMMAIHPAQIPGINAGFTPSEQEVAQAQAVVAAFAARPGAGVVRLEGRMIDAPHLKQARRILAMAGAD